MKKKAVAKKAVVTKSKKGLTKKSLLKKSTPKSRTKKAVSPEAVEAQERALWKKEKREFWSSQFRRILSSIAAKPSRKTRSL